MPKLTFRNSHGQLVDISTVAATKVKNEFGAIFSPVTDEEGLNYVYFGKIVPRIGALLSDGAAYRYLPKSVAYLPAKEQMLADLRAAGFADATTVAVVAPAVPPRVTSPVANPVTGSENTTSNTTGLPVVGSP